MHATSAAPRHLGLGFKHTITAEVCTQDFRRLFVIIDARSADLEWLNKCTGDGQGNPAAQPASFCREVIEPWRAWGTHHIS